ncbi:MAG TPA: hypothetical protein VHJ19_11030, partial [Gammaproteobacteria bacterium]|nr:hypothetical protein [Gammaproteobacteria bacterium]
MRRLTYHFHHYLLILLPALALSACDFVDSGGSQGVSIDPRNRIVNEQTRVVLDATALVDEPEDKTFAWSQVGNPTVILTNANTARASFIAPSVEQRQVLIFRLIVTDPFGASTSDQVKITVNNTPIANAGADRSGRRSTRIALNGAGSTDTDGTITYLWQQTSGPPVASPDGFDTVQASFVVPVAPAGTVLSFRLTVTDNNGATASDIVSVTITAPPPPPPSPPRPTPTPNPTPPPSPDPQPPITGPVPPDDGEDGDGGPPGPPTPPDDDGPAQPPDDGEDGDGGPPGPPTPP